MARVTCSVSIRSDQDLWLKNHSDISLSHLVQQAVDRIMQIPTAEEFENLKTDLESMQKKIDNWKDMFFELQDMLKIKYPEAYEFYIKSKGIK